MREAARALDTYLSTFSRREEKENTKPFRGRYVIKIKLKKTSI